MTPFSFIVISLAVWRLSHGLSKENGPLMLFARLRARLASSQERSGGFFDMISCTSCLSFWVGLGASLFVSNSILALIGYAFAFSGVSLLLESFFSRKLDTLSTVASPTGHDKVTISTSSPSK